MIFWGIKTTKKPDKNVICCFFLLDKKIFFVLLHNIKFRITITNTHKIIWKEHLKKALAKEGLIMQ
jgi:hypothetical protein